MVLALTQFPILTLAKNESVPSYEAQQTDVESQDGKWKYDIALDINDEPRVWITDYLKYTAVGDEFVIPGTIDGMRVQSVDMVLTGSVLNAIKKAKKIVLEENVERIAGTFPRALTEMQIVLPSSLMMIDADVFASTKITSINFPDRLRAIGTNAFQRCTFTDTDIVLPESVELIGDGAFDQANITSVKVGAKANFSPSRFSQTVGAYYDSAPEYPVMPFSNCANLTKVEIDENNPYFKTVDGTVYSSDDIELIFINSYSADYVIPDTVEYICPGALNNKTFDSIYIPSNINKFGSVTFSGSKIGKVIFADDCSYENISKNVFANCKIDEITIPKSVTRIDDEAFYKCGIKRLYFEEGSELTEIGMSAFSLNDIESLDLTNCKNLTKAYQSAFSGNYELTSVDMTDVPMEEIGRQMFSGCTKLKDFKLSKYSRVFEYHSFYNDSELENIDLSHIARVYDDYSFEGCTKININDYLLSSGTTDDGYEYNEFKDHVSIIGYSGESNELVIPDTINSKPVTDIAWRVNFVLHDQYIQSVTLPSNLEFICTDAFQNKKVQEISDFPATLRYIGEDAFSGCSFTSLKLNEGLEYVLPGGIGGQLTSLEIPDSLTRYSGGVSKTVRTLTIGKNIENVKAILDSADYNEKIMKVTISADNSYYCLEHGVLYNKDKTEIFAYYPYFNILDATLNYQIPDTVKIIHDNAFYEAKIIRELDIPDSVEYIGKFAFYDCSTIKNITIPASVKYIGKDAFSESGATSATFADGFKIEALDGTFSHCEDLSSVTYGDVDIKKLLGTYVGSGIKNVDIPESVEVLRSTYFFTDLSNVTELKLPEGLKVLGNFAFDDSKLGITELTIPDGVTAIGGWAFENCTKLQKINFNNVRHLGRGAFQGCESLESVDLTGITYFAENHWSGTFYNCPSLKKITFTRTDGEYDIDENANQCNSLIETVVIGNGVKSVKRKAFSNCKNLETAVISDSVETIADDAFENCDKLTIVCTEESTAMKFAQRNNVNYKTFKIHPIADQQYTGNAIKPALHVTVGESDLKAGSDYTASYTDNIKIGTARATAVGLGDYSIYAATVKFNIFCNHQYTVKTVKPTYAAKGYKLHTCTLCGNSYKTDYTAKLTVPKTAISKLTKKSKAFTVKWKRVSVATGHQIQYSTSKSFKTKKTVTVKGAKNVNKTIKKLKSQKKYYVRVRAYKTYKSKKYYSKWSAVKSVKVK